MAQSGVTYPKGFTAAGVACGLKKNGHTDLAFIRSEAPATSAGIFTTNIVKGHSLQWSRKQIKGAVTSAIAINSGCANACVGEDGEKDAQAFAELVSHYADCPVQEVLIGSTGVIGYRLSLDKIALGLEKAAGEASADGGNSAAVAVMTTDTYEKEAQALLTINDYEIRIGGMAKGSGMIHPNMATMISVLTTDVAITPELLDKALKTTANLSFNRVSIDGDTSVCDKVLILANGMAGNPVIQEESEAYSLFTAALEKVSVELSKMLAQDGEGATKLLEFQLVGAEKQETAHQILNAVCKSPLVKTSFFGEDANWGRILTAAGYSGAVFNPDKVDIFLGSVQVCKNGCGLSFDEQEALHVLKEKEIVITINLNSGEFRDVMWTCDFSYDYVKINGSYRT